MVQSTMSGGGSVRTLAAILLAIAVGAVTAGEPVAVAREAGVGHARLVQGRFASDADQSSLQQALAKTFGSEVRIQHPGDGDGAANDQFGWAVALYGDSALIGAYTDDTVAGVDSGSALVFTRTGGVWSRQAKVLAADAAAGDHFGHAVALLGDTALIGAPLDDTGAGSDAGSAYVFTRSGEVWTQQAKLSAVDAAAADQFGYSVSVSGDTALIGAFADFTAAGDHAGSAYVFVRNASVWSQQAQLSAWDAAAMDFFGWSVALSGDTAVVGAPVHDTAAGSDAGAAYVFVRSGLAWSTQAKLTAVDAGAGDQFGYSVALAADTALVGARLDDTGAGSDVGSAYAFRRSGVVWNQEFKLTASNGAAGDFFGYAVALSGESALVGASGDDTLAGGNAGSAYAFTRSGALWTEQAQLTAAAGAGNDQFGSAVALFDDTALVGAPAHDTAAGINAGFAPVFIRAGALWSEQAALSAGESAASDLFGFSVAVSGESALVGARLDDTAAGNDGGSAHVFVRSGLAWILQASLLASDAAAGDRFGAAVALSGDTAVVGAPWDDTISGSEAGSAYVFTRSGTVWTQQAKLTAADAAVGDEFGFSVALSGDTAMIGARLDDLVAGSNAGSAYVFTRAGSMWSEQAKLVASFAAMSDQFGYSVALSADTALVAAPMDDTGAGSDAGSATVFTRSGTLWSEQTQLFAADATAGDWFGFAVALDGDTALVGAPEDDTAGGSNAGSVYAFTRSGVLWSQQAKLTATDGWGSDEFGWALSLAGDIALIGAPGDDHPGAGNAGSAYVFGRSGAVWSELGKLTAGDGALNDGFGLAVALSGRHALVAKPQDDSALTGNADVGSVRVYLNRHLLSYAAGANGSISGVSPQLVTHGESGTAVSAVADAGYHFVQWSDAAVANPRTDANVTAPISVMATFANAAPVIVAVADRSVLEDSGSTAVTIQISDLESAASSLLVTAASNNVGLIPDPLIAPAASDSERLVLLTPVADGNGGPVTITLTITDPAGASSQLTFEVSVTAVNDAPTLTLGTVATHPAATTGAQSLPAFAAVDFGPADEDASQAVDDFLIDSVSDVDGILAAVDIGNDRTLHYTLTGVGGSATIQVRVRDNGGIANGGADTSLTAQAFTISVTPGADLQVAKSNQRSGLLDGELSVYAIVVANAGPNAVIDATLSDILPSALINASWTCVQASSTATCPLPGTGSGDLVAAITLGVNQYLRFDLLAGADGSVGAFVTNTASVAVPAGTTELDNASNSAVDSDPIVPVGVFSDGFETTPPPAPLSVPGAAQAMQ